MHVRLQGTQSYFQLLLFLCCFFCFYYYYIVLTFFSFINNFVPINIYYICYKIAMRRTHFMQNVSS